LILSPRQAGSQVVADLAEPQIIRVQALKRQQIIAATGVIDAILPSPGRKM
jgi:hypothetical protein